MLLLDANDLLAMISPVYNLGRFILGLCPNDDLERSYERNVHLLGDAPRLVANNLASCAAGNHDACSSSY